MKVTFRSCMDTQNLFPQTDVWILDNELWLSIHSHYMSMEIPEKLGFGHPHKHPGMPAGSEVPVSF